MNLPPTSGITKFSARLETLQQFYHFSPNLPCSIVSLSFSFSRFFAVPFSSLFLLFRFSCSISFARSSNRKRSRKKGRKEGRDRVIQQWAGAPRNCFTREKQGRNKKVSREADGRWRREVRACQCFLFSSRYLQSKIKRTRCFFPLPTFFFLLFSFLFFRLCQCRVPFFGTLDALSLSLVLPLFAPVDFLLVFFPSVLCFGTRIAYQLSLRDAPTFSRGREKPRTMAVHVENPRCIVGYRSIGWRNYRSAESFIIFEWIYLYSREMDVERSHEIFGTTVGTVVLKCILGIYCCDILYPRTLRVACHDQHTSNPMD